MSEKPFQKTSASIPVPGSTWVSTKSFSTVATCRPWTGVREVMGRVPLSGVSGDGGKEVPRVRAGQAVATGVAATSAVGKKSSTSRRLWPVRVGSVSSCSGGADARLIHSVV